LVTCLEMSRDVAFRKEIRPHVDQEMAKQVLDTD